MRKSYCVPILTTQGEVVRETQKAKYGPIETSVFKPVILGAVGFHL
jgi:hypothetical protein